MAKAIEIENIEAIPKAEVPKVGLPLFCLLVVYYPRL